MPRISKAELIRLQKSLKTDEAIGKKFGITRQAIFLVRQKFGIPPIMGKHDARNEKIFSMRKKGASIDKIARSFGLSIPRIYRILKTFKKKRK